jgi:hypothetical protein
MLAGDNRHAVGFTIGIRFTLTRCGADLAPAVVTLGGLDDDYPVGRILPSR